MVVGPLIVWQDIEKISGAGAKDREQHQIIALYKAIRLERR
jgi:hypothetical protein